MQAYLSNGGEHWFWSLDGLVIFGVMCCFLVIWIRRLVVGMLLEGQRVNLRLFPLDSWLCLMLFSSFFVICVEFFSHVIGRSESRYAVVFSLMIICLCWCSFHISLSPVLIWGLLWFSESKVLRSILPRRLIVERAFPKPHWFCVLVNNTSDHLMWC